MALETDADRLDMLTVLGEEITFKGSAIKAIFDSEFVEVNGAEGYHPVVTARDTDVTGAAHGDAVVARSVNYTVVGVQPDGTGITKLLLEAA